jgi:hypothetical protein
MPILNSDALMEIERKVARWREDATKVPHGYPLAEVSDLISTISALKGQKKKWQRLSEIRGKAIAEIYSTASRAIERIE